MGLDFGLEALDTLLVDFLPLELGFFPFEDAFLPEGVLLPVDFLVLGVFLDLLLEGFFLGVVFLEVVFLEGVLLEVDLTEEGLLDDLLPLDLLPLGLARTTDTANRASNKRINNALLITQTSKI